LINFRLIQTISWFFLFSCFFFAPIMVKAQPKVDALSDQQLLEEPRFQPPKDWHFDYFKDERGVRLRYGAARLPYSRGTIVFVTGYTETGEEYFELIKEFQNRGYDVWEMDWHGQGGSQRYFADAPQKIHSDGVGKDADDLYQFVTKIVKPDPKKPIFLIAHSFGCLVSLECLHDHAGLFDKAVLTSPALSFLKKPVWVSQAFANMMTSIGHGQDYAADQDDWPRLEPKLLNPLWHTHDPERLRLPVALFNTHPELAVGGCTWGYLHNYLDAVDMVNKRDYLLGIDTAILIASGLDDKITEPAAHARASRILPHAHIVKIEEGRHELARESDPLRNQYLNAVIDFFDGKKFADQ
jgi:lysophospholipase